MQIDAESPAKAREKVVNKVLEQLPATRASKVKVCVSVPELQLERQSALRDITKDGTVDVNGTVDLSLSALQAAVEIRVGCHSALGPLLFAGGACLIAAVGHRLQSLWMHLQSEHRHRCVLLTHQHSGRSMADGIPPRSHLPRLACHNASRSVFCLLPSADLPLQCHAPCRC